MELAPLARRPRAMTATRLRLATLLLASGMLAGCGAAEARPGEASVEGPRFTCPTGVHPWGAREAPPIADRAQQRAAARRLLAPGPRSSYVVRHAGPSPLGVVALVEGSQRAARAALPRLAGRPVLVGPWTPAVAVDAFGPRAQVRQVVQSQLVPVATRVGRAVRGLEGDAGRVLWDHAGAVVVQWKRPVPPEVSALAGTRRSGVRVVVEPTPYSQADVAAATEAVLAHAAGTGEPSLSSVVGCGDASGLVVGIVPPVRQRAALARDLAAVAGMPVLVVAEPRGSEDAVGG